MFAFYPERNITVLEKNKVNKHFLGLAAAEILLLLPHVPPSEVVPGYVNARAASG
jgi:hypothetical protein